MLRDLRDAYGHQLYDFFKGKQVIEIVERDDGLIDPSETYPKYYLADYKDWSLREKIAGKYAKGRVLDIGCGGGRWSLYLQKKGHDVVAIDNSSLAIKVSKERGVRDARIKSITDVDSSFGNFDTILMIGNNFGLFGRPKRAKVLLERFYNLTNPGARIIAESLDIYKPPVDPVHRQYHLRNRRRGQMAGQVRMRIRYLTYTSPWFDYLLVSPKEMIRILLGTGWKVERFIRSKRGPAYIAIIKKQN